MAVMRVGLRLEAMEAPVRAAVETAARMGAAGVEIDAAGELAPDPLTQTGRRHLAHLIRSHGLDLAGLGLVTRHGFDEPDRLDARVAHARKVLGLAHDLGAPFVVHSLGHVPQDPQSPRSLAFRDAVSAIAREAERVGVRFAVETGLDEPAVLAKFLEETNTPVLGVVYNHAHLLAKGAPMDANIERLGPHLVGVHVKDVVRTGSTLSGFRETPIGEGEIDWARLVSLLASVEYEGFLTVDREDSKRPVDELERGIAHLRTILRS